MLGMSVDLLRLELPRATHKLPAERRVGRWAQSSVARALTTRGHCLIIIRDINHYTFTMPNNRGCLSVGLTESQRRFTFLFCTVTIHSAAACSGSTLSGAGAQGKTSVLPFPR